MFYNSMFQLYPLYGNHFFVVTVSFVIAMMVVTSFILLKSVQVFFALKSLILYHFFAFLFISTISFCFYGVVIK